MTASVPSAALLTLKRPPLRVVAAVVLVIALTGGLLVALRGHRAGADVASSAVTVSNAACGPNWVAPRSGETTFEVDNTTKSTIFGVDLVGADQLTVYGEIEMLAPGTEVPLTVTLGPGQYSFQCESFSGSTSFSRVERVSGPKVGNAVSYLPINASQVQNATLVYRSSITAGMAQLVKDTDTLRTAVAAGNLTEARARWLPAHLDYERLGAAYDTFGDFDSEIDGRPVGLTGGVNSPKFAGFLRLEYGLWHNQPASELRPIADKLATATSALLKQFPQMLMPANDLSLRTHEILENALQFELTGELDEGSHTTLATVDANVQGTELALQALAPLVRQVDPALLGEASTGLTRLGALLDSYKRPDGSWTPLQGLSQGAHERLDAAVSSLLEQLEQVPDRLELPLRPGSDDS
jgi:high-affinity iron transporter